MKIVMKTVSVIIPVYNTEKYIEECISSVVNQTFKDIEIILVDDGSTDNSSKLCDLYSKKYDFINVIHKNNEGLGLTRNAGMMKASGRYIIFVDSDDYIEKNTIETVLNKILLDDADVCYYSNKCLRTTGICENEVRHYPKTLVGSNIVNELFPKFFGTSQRKIDSYSIGSACMAMYNLEFLRKNDLYFQSEREVLCEDIIFNANVCLKCKKVTFVNDCLYVYRENLNSLTHTYREDRFNKAEKLYQIENSIISNNCPTQEAYLRAKDTFITNVIVSIKQEVAHQSAYSYKRRKILEIANNERLKECLNIYPLKDLTLSKQILLHLLRLKFVDMVLLIVFIKVKSSKNIITKEKYTKRV